MSTPATAGATFLTVAPNNAPVVNINQMALGWAKCPTEVKNNIIKFLVKSDKKEVLMPCLTSRPYKPGLQVQALLVNYHFWQEGFLWLRLNHIFVFDNFGSDLLAMTKGWNDRYGEAPNFRKTVFRVGDPSSIPAGILKSSSFANVLHRLSTPFRTSHLTITLELHNFISISEFMSFVAALANVKVNAQFELNVHSVYGPLNPFDMVLLITQAIGLPYVPFITTAKDRSPSGVSHSLHTTVPPLHLYRF